MVRYKLFFGLIAAFSLSLMFIGQLPAESNSARDRRVKPPFVSESYRSPGPGHKIIVYAHEQELQNRILSEGGSLIADYGAFSLLVAPSSATDVAQSAEGSGVRDDMNLIELRAGAFDTSEGEPATPMSLSEPEPTGDQLFLVQMIGPIKQEWFDQLQANAEIISYVPN